MNIADITRIFKNQGVLEGRERRQLGAEEAQSHIDRITDVYDELEAADDIPGVDQWLGTGQVKRTKDGQTSTLTYTGDTRNGQASLLHQVGSPYVVETTTHETYFEGDTIRQLQVYKNYRGTSVSLLNLDRAHPEASFQVWL